MNRQEHLYTYYSRDAFCIMDFAEKENHKITEHTQPQPGDYLYFSYCTDHDSVGYRFFKVMKTTPKLVIISAKRGLENVPHSEIRLKKVAYNTISGEGGLRYKYKSGSLQLYGLLPKAEHDQLLNDHLNMVQVICCNRLVPRKDVIVSSEGTDICLNCWT